MRSVTVRLDDLKTTILCLGYVGENEHTRINIDAKKMYDQYPTASASLTVCPPAGESYPAVITRDGDMVIWDITDSDLVAEGSGEIQLSFTQGETVAKTFIGRFKVSRSLVPTGDIPSGIDDFLTRAGAALTAIPETIDEALAEAKASGEFDGADGQDGQDGADGFSPIATVTKSGNKATISITDANGTTTAEVTDGADGAPGQDGAPGIDGFSPRATVSKSGSTATITITDAAGTTTAQISDGESADIIDDTAGAGDTDKVWSADKSSSLLTEINSIEEELGMPTERTIPSGYQSANYSNQAGTMQFKYENGKLVLKKTNRDGEITISNASLTIGSTLGFTTTEKSCIEFEYDNGDPAGSNVIRGRLYKPNFSAYINFNIPIPTGKGTETVNLYDLAEEYEKDISTYPVFVIYGIQIGTGTNVSGATVWIEGFTDSASAIRLSSRVTTLEENVSDLTETVESIEQSIGTLPEDVADLQDDVDDIQDELGLNKSYSVPSGYQSANYSNQAGTMQFKYENSKLVLKKTNSSGEINTSNAGLTIGSTLGVTVEESTAIQFGYDNGDSAGSNVIRGRLYKPNFSSNINLNIDIPAGQGNSTVNLYSLAVEKEKDISTYPVFVIYGIQIGTGTEVSGATVWIDGFTSTETLKEQVNALSTSVETLSSELEQLSADVEEIIEDIGSGVKIGENLYEKRYEDLGYPNYQTGNIELYTAEYIEMTSAHIPVAVGDVITVQEWVKGTPKSRIAYYDSGKAFVGYDNMPNNSYVLEGSIYHVKFSKTIETGVAFIRVGYGSYGDGKIMVTKNSIPSGWIPAAVDMGSRLYNVADSYNLRGFAHTGKKELAPENTIKSFMLAAQEGYTMVETDVRFTSDNVPVLLHDATINRTARNADGTELSSDVYIHEITYAQAYEYDFGIWKGSGFAGTKIMRFDDFIVLCKRLNLYPAIEIKNDENHISEAQVHIMVDIVNEHHMINKCHFQSYQLKCLTWVKKYEPRAWLGMSASSSAENPISEKRCIELKYFLKTQFNETFISAKDQIPENIALIKQYGIPLYTFAEESEYMDLDPLVIGVVSDDAPYPAYVREHILDDLNT